MKGWTKKQTEKFRIPNYSKEYFRKLIILKLLGNINNKKIAEFGCGNGYWTRIFATRGADCMGIDSSKQQINAAKEEERKYPLGINYLLKDVTNLSGIKSNSFDIIFIDYVLLEIPKKEELTKVFKEAHRILKNKGILLVSEKHPFDPIVQKGWILPKGFNYFTSGAKIKVSAKQVNGSRIWFTDYHWTLEDYFTAIINAGFKINLVNEPKASKEIIKRYPILKLRENFPKDIIIMAEKSKSF